MDPTNSQAVDSLIKGHKTQRNEKHYPFLALVRVVSLKTYSGGRRKKGETDAPPGSQVVSHMIIDHVRRRHEEKGFLYTWFV